MLYPYLIAFCASFLYIALKSWQQLNVVHKQYWWIVPTSLSMAVCEVYIIATTAHNGWGWFVIPIGLGGGLGSMCSTYLHDRMLRAPKKISTHEYDNPLVSTIKRNYKSFIIYREG